MTTVKNNIRQTYILLRKKQIGINKFSQDDSDVLKHVGDIYFLSPLRTSFYENVNGGGKQKAN